jgi:PAS domain-containing protein
MVAALVTVLMFAMLKFAAAARGDATSPAAPAPTAFLSAALQEAVTKLKAQERANAARADASERLNGEIISSLTAGLVMVDLNGDVRILNPAGRRMLDLPEVASTEPFERSRACSRCST